MTAIINLSDKEGIDILLGKSSLTTDLASYELGNAVWKLAHRTSLEEVHRLMELFTGILGQMEIVRPDPLKTLALAVKEGITYYDAAYLQVAIEKKQGLVTDDERLLRAAEGCAETATSSQLRQ